MIAAALLLLATATSRAVDAPELKSDFLHADLPLFGDRYADKWPQSFTEPSTGDFGCTSRVGFGDWRFDQAGDEEPSWFRFSNYGVVHCWANVAEAGERSELDGSSSRPAFFVLLGRERDHELWALQLGARPGSDYILLSRPISGQGLVTAFTVQQRACPRGRLRRGHSLDILSTSYCSIRSAEHLLALARDMSRLAPLGTLERVSPPAQTQP